MIETITELTKINFPSLFISVFIILMGFKAIVSLFEWISEKLGIETKWMRKKRKEHELLVETSRNLSELQDKHNKDVEQSIAHDRLIKDELSLFADEMKRDIGAVFEKLDMMQQNTNQRFEESERKNNKRIRAELKDKISQSYRYYHSLGEINDMELEALEDLIEEYEAADGENSFVHSVVQKEMYIWKKKNSAAENN